MLPVKETKKVFHFFILTKYRLWILMLIKRCYLGLLNTKPIKKGKNKRRATVCFLKLKIHESLCLDSCHLDDSSFYFNHHGLQHNHDDFISLDKKSISN